MIITDREYDEMKTDAEIFVDKIFEEYAMIKMGDRLPLENQYNLNNIDMEV